MPVAHARALPALRLPPMVSDNRSQHRTNFTVSIEADEGRVFDRHTRVRTRAHDPHRGATRRRADDLHQPATSSVMAQPGGVLSRAGHTEAASDLAMLAGLEPDACWWRSSHADGSMARRPELEVFAQAHGLRNGLDRAADLAHVFRRAHDRTRRCARHRHRARPVRLVTYRDRISRELHFALVCAANPTPTCRRWCACTSQEPLSDLLHWRGRFRDRRARGTWRASPRGNRRDGGAGRDGGRGRPARSITGTDREAAPPRLARMAPHGVPARRSSPTSPAPRACSARARHVGLAGFGWRWWNTCRGTGLVNRSGVGNEAPR